MDNLEQNAVVIVAAGRGSRIADDRGPKQYRILGEEAVLQHTICQFTSHPDIHLVQVVIHADDQRHYDELVKPNSKLMPPTIGGATRQASCKAGIDALPTVAKTLVHDAARPFVSHRTISNVLDGITANTCALPASNVADTIKRADQNGLVQETVSRDNLYLAQTPQGFMHAEIKRAHAQACANSEQEFTDDAAIAEWAGFRVRLVDGNSDNFKITTQDDLAVAETKTQMKSIPDVRTGNGYDVHTLGPGKMVILCGIEIPHSQSLQGHSDADVGLHALTDALLGTIGAGDIGSHFPPSDQKWRGAASDQFLKHAVELVTSQGGTITHMDVTIICEAPKIGPHRDVMRQRMSEICDVSMNRVSVKATTNERIGFIGREEGIAAIATATVVFQ